MLLRQKRSFFPFIFPSISSHIVNLIHVMKNLTILIICDMHANKTFVLTPCLPLDPVCLQFHSIKSSFRRSTKKFPSFQEIQPSSQVKHNAGQIRFSDSCEAILSEIKMLLNISFVMKQKIHEDQKLSKTIVFFQKVTQNKFFTLTTLIIFLKVS